MPLYEYQCEACTQRFERIQKFSDPPVDTCPTCGGKVRKLLSSPAIQFKGSGWYITDYAKKDKKGGGEKPASGGSDSKSDAAAKTESSASSTSASTSSAEKPSTPTTKSE